MHSVASGVLVRVHLQTFAESLDQRKILAEKSKNYEKNTMVLHYPLIAITYDNMQTNQ